MAPPPSHRFRRLSRRSRSLSLSLQRSLFRYQRAQISSALGEVSAAFRAYESVYLRCTARYRRESTVGELVQKASAADVVFVGDYHTLGEAKSHFISLIESTSATDPRRQNVLALELVEARHQLWLDGYLAGTVSERSFVSKLTLKALWPKFRPLLEHARKRKWKVVAIDRRATGANRLRQRDESAANQVKRAWQASAKKARIWVLTGQYHVAPPHLPRAVAQRIPEAKPLIIYQNCDRLYWKLASLGLSHATNAVQLTADVYCWLNTSPVICQQSYLDYLDEASFGHGPLVERFAAIAQRIATVMGLRRELPRLLASTVVHERLRPGLGRTRASSSAKKRQHVQSRSPSHLAAGAMRAFRACLSSSTPVSPTNAQAFYAAVLDEAFAFFGAKLLNPALPYQTVPQWVVLSLSPQTSLKERLTAGYVVAAALDADAAPPSRRGDFVSATLALGQLLGGTWFQDFERGNLTPATLVTQMKTSEAEAPAAFARWRKRLSTAPTHPRHPPEILPEQSAPRCG